MEKILISYSSPSVNHPVNALVREVKEKLESQGHFVRLVSDKSHSNALKLLRVVSVLNIGTPGPFKNSPQEKLRQALYDLMPKSLRSNLAIALQRFNTQSLNWPTVERINSQLSKLANGNGNGLHKVRKGKTTRSALFARLLLQQMAVPIGHYSAFVREMLNNKEFLSQAKLRANYPGHHVFVMRSEPVFELYSSSSRRDEYNGVGRTAEENASDKALREEKRSQFEADCIKAFEPRVLHFSGDLLPVQKSPKPKNILFFHHSGFAAFGRGDFLSYFGRAPKAFVSIAYPVMTRPATTPQQAILQRKRFNVKALEDEEETRKAGLLEGVPEAIVKGITDVVNKRNRVRKSL